MHTSKEVNQIIKSLKRTVSNLEKRVADLEKPNKPKLITYTITRAGVQMGIDQLMGKSKKSLKTY